MAEPDIDLKQFAPEPHPLAADAKDACAGCGRHPDCFAIEPDGFVQFFYAGGVLLCRDCAHEDPSHEMGRLRAAQSEALNAPRE